MYRLKKDVSTESGFTLIEILVVVLIIGILSAIAVPVFLNQRRTAIDARVVSDTRNLMTVVDKYFGDNQSASTMDLNYLKTNGTKSDGVKVYVYGNAKDYCITADHLNGEKYRLGKTYAENGGNRPYYLLQSSAGGVVMPESAPVSTLPCFAPGYVIWP